MKPRFLIPIINLSFLIVSWLTNVPANPVEDDNRITLLDAADDVKRKLKKAFCQPGNVEVNGVLSFVENIIFPVFKQFHLMRKDDHGGPIDYTNYDQIVADFKSEVSIEKLSKIKNV